MACMVPCEGGAGPGTTPDDDRVARAASAHRGTFRKDRHDRQRDAEPEGHQGAGATRPWARGAGDRRHGEVRIGKCRAEDLYKRAPSALRKVAEPHPDLFKKS